VVVGIVPGWAIDAAKDASARGMTVVDARLSP